jgi:DNA (cytosine-5)-methyltransferase 1
MALDQVHIDLEAEGYEVESIIIPACAVDAPHRRDRVWIVANSTSLRNGGGSCVSKKQRERMVQGKQKRAEIRMQVKGCGSFTDKNVANSKRFRLERAGNEASMGEKAKKACAKRSELAQAIEILGCSYSPRRRQGTTLEANWPTGSGICRVSHGIPNRVDRIKGLGNAIVPQVAAEIIRCIVEVSK